MKIVRINSDRKAHTDITRIHIETESGQCIEILDYHGGDIKIHNAMGNALIVKPGCANEIIISEVKD